MIFDIIQHNKFNTDIKVAEVEAEDKSTALHEYLKKNIHWTQWKERCNGNEEEYDKVIVEKDLRVVYTVGDSMTGVFNDGTIYMTVKHTNRPISSMSASKKSAEWQSGFSEGYRIGRAEVKDLQKQELNAAYARGVRYGRENYNAPEHEIC